MFVQLCGIYVAIVLSVFRVYVRTRFVADVWRSAACRFLIDGYVLLMWASFDRSAAYSCLTDD